MTSKYRPISEDLKSRGIVLSPGDQVAMERAEAIIGAVYSIGSAIGRACRFLAVRLASRPAGLDVGRELAVITDRAHENVDLNRKNVAAEAANENRSDHAAA